MRRIDTHQLVKELVSVGTSEEQAEVFVDMFVAKEELNSVEKEHLQLATKTDIIRLESKIEMVKTDLKGEISSINIDIKWIRVLLMIILGILLTGLAKTFI
jgi:hypothetical protein